MREANHAEVVLEVCVPGRDPNLMQFFYLLATVLGACYPLKPTRAPLMEQQCQNHQKLFPTPVLLTKAAGLTSVWYETLQCDRKQRCLAFPKGLTGPQAGQAVMLLYTPLPSLPFWSRFQLRCLAVLQQPAFPWTPEAVGRCGMAGSSWRRLATSTGPHSGPLSRAGC